MSIIERKKNGVVIGYRAIFRYKDSYGISKQLTKCAKTKQEAKKYEKELEKEYYLHGNIITSSSITLNNVYEEYLKLVAINTLSPNTFVFRKSIYENHVRDEIGSAKIKDMDYKSILFYFNKIKKKGVSKEYCQSIKNMLNQVFKHALKCGYIAYNPIRDVELPYINEEVTKERKPISLEDFQSLYNSFSIDQDKPKYFKYRSYQVALVIGWNIGLRISETLALKKSDFDFINNTVNIHSQINSRAVRNKTHEWTTDRLKTKSSSGIKPIPQSLSDYLMEWFNENPYELVCCDNAGGYIGQAPIENAIKHNAKKLGLDGFVYHSLRHTLSSRLITSGVDIVTTQKIMRHSNANTTINRYTHTNIENMSNALNMISQEKNRKKRANSVHKVN